jgi:hypothetical protein
MAETLILWLTSGYSSPSKALSLVKLSLIVLRLCSDTPLWIFVFGNLLWARLPGRTPYLLG